jgi:CheY-like chemotaxis protein
MVFGKRGWPVKMRKMPRLRLIHWNAAEATRYLALLQKAGHRVEYSPEFSSQLMREWRLSPPDAFVIDLSRLPSHGREIAVALRQSKATRHIPIVFCEGEEEKVAKTRALLLDAVFCKFPKLITSLRSAGRSTAQEPAIPPAMMDRYAGRTTAQKLGIRPGAAVMLVDPPRSMPAALGELPEAVTFVENASDRPAVTLCFATDPHELRQQISSLRGLAKETKLWICWRKGKLAEKGVSERVVRETGMALGLVDYKICSVSEIWSGLLFAAKAAPKS